VRIAYLPHTPVYDEPAWHLTHGERFALEGILTQLEPRLSLVVGAAEAATVRRVAGRSAEVHALDAAPGVAETVAPVPNAVVHPGSRAELPGLLERLAGDGRSVELAFVDGDPTRDGVQRDARALLASPACTHTTIVVHDAGREEVREGLEALDLPAHPKVSVCMLDLVPGAVVAAGHPAAGEVRGGLALVVLADAPWPAQGTDPPRVSVGDLLRGRAPAPGA
jgi:hypothetical protein